MGMGVSVFVIALGAILAFAVEDSLPGLNITVVGWILLITGLIGLIVTTFVFGPRLDAGEAVDHRPDGRA
jgi:hypothetical protein